MFVCGVDREKIIYHWLQTCHLGQAASVNILSVFLSQHAIAAYLLSDTQVSDTNACICVRCHFSYISICFCPFSPLSAFAVQKKQEEVTVLKGKLQQSQSMLKEVRAAIKLTSSPLKHILACFFCSTLSPCALWAAPWAATHLLFLCFPPSFTTFTLTGKANATLISQQAAQIADLKEQLAAEQLHYAQARAEDKEDEIANLQDFLRSSLQPSVKATLDLQLEVADLQLEVAEHGKILEREQEQDTTLPE